MTDVKERLLKSGKKLFSTKGFKDTKVAEITKKAGIATGTFYNYYPSKDTLFMKIFLKENMKLKRDILDRINLEADPMKVINEMMIQNYQGMTKNPILNEWYNRETFNKIEQKYREEEGIKDMNFLYEYFINIVKKWQREGKMRDDIEAEMIMAIFNAIIIIDTHKEEIGIQYFPKLIEYIAEFVIKGLIIRSE
jgi:AcrR family transcriptional regulator